MLSNYLISVKEQMNMHLQLPMFPQMIIWCLLYQVVRAQEILSMEKNMY